jgi:hypothetical protein
MEEKQKKSKNIHRRNKVRPPDLADWEVPEPTLSQNPTDHNLYIHSTYAGPAGPPENPFENEVLYFYKNDIHTDEWQENVVKNATVLNAIKLYELAHLLALDDEYDDILPDLWEYCGFNDDPMNRFPKWDQKMIEKPHSRARVWYWILSRWTTYRYFKNKKCEDIKSFYFHGLKSNVPRMPLYNYFNEFEKVAEDMPQSCEQYIKLDDFLSYLLFLQNGYFNNDIQIPLPEWLSQKKIPTGKEREINIDEIIEDTRRNKYIALGLLPFVMAEDEQYSKDLLLELWKKYQCDRRGPKEPLTETYEDRVGTWHHLFERLAFGRVQGVPIKKSSPLYLPLYYFNDKEGALEKYDRTKNPGDPQVKLDDLKEYLTETIEIPLPGRLFPKTVSSDLISTVTANRVMQIWQIDVHELIQLIINGLNALKPDGSSVIDGSLKNGIREIAVSRALGAAPKKTVQGLIFEISDLDKFRNEHPEHDFPSIEIFRKKNSQTSLEDNKKSLTDEVKKREKNDENYIRNSKVSYESDEEFKIQPGQGKPWININRDSWSHKKTQKDIIWNDFIKILQSNDYIYCLGSTKDRTTYDKRRKRLSEMNLKLIHCFNKEFDIDMPTSFQTYERCYDKKPGTYKFKFQIVDHIDEILKVDERKKRDTVEKISILADQYKDADNNKQQTEIWKVLDPLIQKAQKEKWITKDDITKLLSSKEEESKYDKV